MCAVASSSRIECKGRSRSRESRMYSNIACLIRRICGCLETGNPHAKKGEILSPFVCGPRSIAGFMGASSEFKVKAQVAELGTRYGKRLAR